MKGCGKIYWVIEGIAGYKCGTYNNLCPECSDSNEETNKEVK